MEQAFEYAIDHAMHWEVGGFWKLTPEVEAGLIGTKDQKRAVGYVNDPLDAGGETKFGVAKNANPDLDISKLTWAEAKDVYYKKYWLAGSCDKLPARVAFLHLDGCINNGVGRANKFLQRALGIPEASVDGAIGPKTLQAVAAANELQLCSAICDQRKKFYLAIVDRKPDQARFLKGWMARITDVEANVMDPAKTFNGS